MFSQQAQLMAHWYFAYGSNLWIDQMVQRTGPMRLGDDQPRCARLRGYRLAFNMRGDCGQRFANVVQPGDEVLGVIYRCTAETLTALDVYESGYERRRLTVVDDLGQNVEVVAYVAKPEFLAECGTPSDEYLQRILRGARQHCLPEAYIQTVLAIAAGREV